MKKNKLLVLFIICLFLYPLSVAAQRNTISCVVRDANTYREITNVNIIIKGSTKGTTTNISGAFSLDVMGVPPNAVIEFSHIAYLSLEVSLDSLRDLKYVYLQPRVIQLPRIETEAE